MTFLTEAGEKSTLSVSGFKANLTKDNLNTLMDTIINMNVFLTNSGALVIISGAQLTQRQITKF